MSLDSGGHFVWLVLRKGEGGRATRTVSWTGGRGLDQPVSLVDCHLAEGFGYQDRGSITDFFTTTEPFPIRLPLDRLL